MRVGLISDTHGLLRPAALEALRGCEHIIHAGDIGGAAILEALGQIAPVTAVRGNNDRDAWAASIADMETVEVGGRRIYVIHDIAQLDIDPAAAGVHAVIAGHSHKPASRVDRGVLYVNPGSAGPRRFTLPVSIGFLHLAAAAITAELRTLS